MTPPPVILQPKATMFRTIPSRFAVALAVCVVIALGMASVSRSGAGAKAKDTKALAELDKRFKTTVQPFVERYCVSCHGAKKQEASLDLSIDNSVSHVVRNIGAWEQVLERVHDKEMPPAKAKAQPKADERDAVVAWIRDLRQHEANRSAGDPGVVLARRLSNAEVDATLRDLTGVDIRPTREFPVDPANQAGFDNTGESLTMSPALLRKYLPAARHVADHIVFAPHGFVFAPYPVVAETDRDKYCVQRIVDFYQRHEVDLADYLQAAWKHRFRVHLNRGGATLADFAAEAKLNPKYLALVHESLSDEEHAGPMAALQSVWQAFPTPKESKDDARGDSLAMRDLVTRLRKQIKPDIKKISVNGMSSGAQPIVLWRNAQVAAKHRSYSGDVAADLKKLSEQLKGKEERLKRHFDGKDGDAAKKSLVRFCDTFPDTFVVVDRGPYFSPNQANSGRPLTAGFHLMQGYFRDDAPLCDLILTDAEKRELDGLWHELNFVALAPMRQYADFIFFERAEPPRFMFEAEFDFARSEDKDCVSEAKMDKLAKLYVAKAVKRGAKGEALEAVEGFFQSMSAEIRTIERGRLAAEPSHLDALVAFAGLAYRRPLSKAEADDLRAFYRQLRAKDDPGHEEALRDVVASVLVSPNFCFRYHRADPGAAATALTDLELASRLSYFLWSSMPDVQLMALASQGKLRDPKVLLAQAQRMLRDPKVRGLATEFAGNWLDIRRFEEHNAVDRQRFPTFTNELRLAMFEEPIRYFVDVAQRDRSVLDFLHGKDTFVNPLLAKHYGMPAPKGKDEWRHVDDADRYGRGGLLPMAVFLTKNAPGLRTSPVKRGYWVVRRVLGETIPPPPATVPELPKDESKLGELTLPQVLARHRDDAACAGCHKRFDAVGVVFEDYGPIGELRKKDLGGRPVQNAAPFPDGKERTGLAGLREYLKEKRQTDFTDNLCRKLLSYALGRGLQLSDQQTVDAMKTKLANEDYRFGSLVEAIIASPQFLQKRGREYAE